MPAYKDEAHGTFYASFYYTDFTGTKRKKMKRGFKLKRDALEWERQFLLQKNADPDMRFGDFVSIYRSEKRERIREHTWESKDNIIDTKILPYFKDRTLSEIEPRDVIAWQNTLMGIRQKNGKPYSPTYLKSIHSQLSANLVPIGSEALIDQKYFSDSVATMKTLVGRIDRDIRKAYKNDELKD